MLICLNGGLGNQIGNFVFGKFMESKGIEVHFIYSNNVSDLRFVSIDKVFDIKPAKTADVEKFLDGKVFSGGACFSLLWTLFSKNIWDKIWRNNFWNFLKRIRKEYGLFPKKNISLLSKVASYRDVLRYNLDNVVVCDCYVPIKEFNDVEFKKGIKEGFRLREELNRENKEVLEKIKSYSNSVGIHIRRGDFIDMKIPVVTKEYLLNSIDKLCGEIGGGYNKEGGNRNGKNGWDNNGVHFFVFSNGMEWAKDVLLGIENIDFIDINDEDKGYLDFVLMNNTRHRIYSPSSFSNWLRYLNPYNNSIEIIPGAGDVEAVL